MDHLSGQQHEHPVRVRGTLVGLTKCPLPVGQLGLKSNQLFTLISDKDIHRASSVIPLSHYLDRAVGGAAGRQSSNEGIHEVSLGAKIFNAGIPSGGHGHRSVQV